MSIFFPMIPLKPFPASAYRLYIAVANDGSLANAVLVVVDTATDIVNTSIHISPPSGVFCTPWECAVTPDQTMVFLSEFEDFGGLALIDTSTNTVTAYDNNATGFAWAPTSGMAVINVAGQGKFYLGAEGGFGVDPVIATLGQDNIRGPDIDTPNTDGTLVASPDGSIVVGIQGGAGITVVTTVDDSFIAQPISISGNLKFGCFSPDGLFFYATYVSSPGSHTHVLKLDVSDWSIVQNLDLGDTNQRNAIVMHPDGTKLYVAGDTDITTIDNIETTMIVGLSVSLVDGSNQLCFLPDSSKLYISSTVGLRAYDPITDTVGSNIAVGTNAWGMCVVIV